MVTIESKTAPIAQRATCQRCSVVIGVSPWWTCYGRDTDLRKLWEESQVFSTRAFRRQVRAGIPHGEMAPVKPRSTQALEASRTAKNSQATCRLASARFWRL